MDLIWLAVVFLVLALVFYLLGARGIAGFSMEIAKILVDDGKAEVIED